MTDPKKPLTDEDLDGVFGGTGDPDRPIVVGVPPNPCVAPIPQHHKIGLPPGPCKTDR